MAAFFVHMYYLNPKPILYYCYANLNQTLTNKNQTYEKIFFPCPLHNYNLCS